MNDETDTRPVARHYARKAQAALNDMKRNVGKVFDIGSIELEADRLLAAYEHLGRALDALGVLHLKPEHCKHPEELRLRVNPGKDLCRACGMVYTMYAGRTSCYRKWLMPLDPNVGSGTAIAEALLENEREKIRGASGG